MYFILKLYFLLKLFYMMWFLICMFKLNNIHGQVSPKHFLMVVDVLTGKKKISSCMWSWVLFWRCFIFRHKLVCKLICSEWICCLISLLSFPPSLSLSSLATLPCHPRFFQCDLFDVFQLLLLLATQILQRHPNSHWVKVKSFYYPPSSSKLGFFYDPHLIVYNVPLLLIFKYFKHTLDSGPLLMLLP